MYTCLGKAFAMLWQIWLLVGPKYIDMRICLDSVAGINTDFGTERKVVDLPDVLIDFMHFIGCPVPKNAVRETWLLPNALPIAGWHHIFDGLIRFGLYQFAWFPSWLLTLKGCLRFFRNHRVDFLERLRSDGLSGAASVLEGISFPTFAAWRWRKVKSVCVAVYEAFHTMRLEACMECLKNI